MSIEHQTSVSRFGLALTSSLISCSYKSKIVKLTTRPLKNEQAKLASMCKMMMYIITFRVSEPRSIFSSSKALLKGLKLKKIDGLDSFKVFLAEVSYTPRDKPPPLLFAWPRHQHFLSTDSIDASICSPHLLQSVVIFLEL